MHCIRLDELVLTGVRFSNLACNWWVASETTNSPGKNKPQKAAFHSDAASLQPDNPQTD
jgi:hypothetical protein